MSDEQMVTEAEARRRERAAWDEAAYRLSCCGAGNGEAVRLRDELFPLPKIVRQRVVEVEGRQYRYSPERGFFEFLYKEVWFRFRSKHIITPELIRALYDLMQNPTEEVEDGGD